MQQGLDLAARNRGNHLSIFCFRIPDFLLAVDYDDTVNLSRVNQHGYFVGDNE